MESFDQVVFTINSDVKPSYAEQMFLYYLINIWKTKQSWLKKTLFHLAIVCKKTDEWYIEWQRVVERVTTNDNEWYNEWKRVAMSGTTSDNEWQRVTANKQWVTASGSKWYNK